MDRVERAAEHAERAGHDRRRRAGHTRSQGCASHSSSTPPMRTRSPAAIPARRSSRSMPRRASSRWNRSADSSTSKLVCAAIRSIRCAAHAEDAVGVALDAEAVGHRLDPVDDDPGRLGRLGQLRGVGQERGDAVTEAPPAPRRCRPRWPPRRSPSAARARWNAGQASRRGRQVHLVERDEHRLGQQRRIVGPQLLADDVVVPLGVARRAVDDVDEDPRPLDVAQEGVTRDPRRCWRLRSGPGTSAIVGRRSSSSPRSITPRFGSSVVNG